MSNEPDFDSDEDAGDGDEERRRAAEATVAYLCGALRFFGVEKVVAAFEDTYDDLSIDVPVYQPALPGDLPFGLAGRLGQLWDAFLPRRWEYEEGISGTITIDVASGKVTRQARRREEHGRGGDGVNRPPGAGSKGREGGGKQWRSSNPQRDTGLAAMVAAAQPGDHGVLADWIEEYLRARRPRRRPAVRPRRPARRRRAAANHLRRVPLPST